MMKISKLFITFLYSFFYISASSQIILDEQVADWSPSLLVEEEIGDNISGIDIESLWIQNDDKYLYIRIDLSQEINLQSDNDLSLFIDVDQNSNTGFQTNGLGAEFSFYFGDRTGFINANGGFENINHAEIGLIVSPTVSSKTFEIAIERTLGNLGVLIDGSIDIVLDNDAFNGDMLPNQLGGVSYTVNNDVLFTAPEISFEKSSETDFRILSYNVLQDRFFQNSARASYQRILQALDPEIIAFQEIYDNSSNQTKNLVEEFLPSDIGENWYHDKVGSDIIVVSRYPIVRSDFINGNGAFIIDVNGKEILLINMHLPCCDNNAGRQEEIDDLLQYIRRAKNGQLSYDLEQNTPIFIVGDSNLVGPASQRNSLRDGDIINNSDNGPDFSPDWDGTSLEDLITNTTGTPGSYTWYNPGGSFFPGRLDYVFYSGSVIHKTNAFSLFTTGLNQNDLIQYNLSQSDTENASDHFPLVSDWSFDEIISDTDDLLEASAFNIFPNPFIDEITIQTKTGSHLIRSVELYNSAGQLVNSNYVGDKLQMENIKKPGIYFIKITDVSGALYMSKIVRL